MKRFVQLVFLALVLAAPVKAEIMYSCDFETEASRNRWVVNPGTTYTLNHLKNKWYIGAPGNNDRNGNYGLYISDDNGATAHYSKEGCWVYAYDTLTLAHQSPDKDYTLIFDYSAMGNMSSTFDGLYAFWVPMLKANGDTLKLMSIPSQSGQIPDEVKNYAIKLSPSMPQLSGVSTWRQCVANIKNKDCDGTPHYLVFVWTNGSFLPQQPGGMVDNIMITDVPPCAAPKDLKVSVQGTTSIVSWTGTGAAQYEVSAYSYKSNSWYGPKLVTDTFTMFANITMGETDFVVRAQCDSALYSLKNQINKLVYYPDELCVDYLNLDNATCYIATMGGSEDTRTFNSYTQVSPVDKGPERMESRHTVHMTKNELEPRTGNMAPTIPEGELASVRLGNWNNGAETERIEFSFQVDTVKYPVLLLKYMPILEAPSHGDEGNPRFKLDLLINGVSIGDCGKADFNCNDVVNAQGQLLDGAEEQGWHVTPPEVAFPDDSYRENVVWKEWTTVGVNLRNPAYAGKTLTARLSTFDCPYSAHCGYAYFTLGCSDGKFKDMKCGEINPWFKAPEGFLYRWALASDEVHRRADGSFPEQYVVGRQATLEAGEHDNRLYVVDCMFVQDTTCYFSLYASTLATNPISEMEKPKIMKNCREGTYKVQFDASPSWVKEVDHVLDTTYVSKNFHIETYEWTVEGISGGWSDEVKPTFSFPVTGGDFIVKLRTTCGTCEDILSYNLHLDSLGATRDTIVDVLCDADRKAGYHWAERTDTAYHAYGLDSVKLFNEATSCDSIIYLRLIEPFRIFEDTMVMQDSFPFNYHGREYPMGTVSMIDTVPSPTNCDTTYVLNLEVYEPLAANLAKTDFILCEGDDLITLAYDITRGRCLRYSYTFETTGIADKLVSELQKKGHYEISIPVDPDIYPNVYTGKLLLEDSLPQRNLTFQLTLTVQYASSVIAQRWNDVLAIRNTEFNGGYVFDSVQWYVNGLPIENAVDFNYFAGEDQLLRFGEPYSALLTRNDGVKLFTCAFVPAKVPAEITDMPSLVPLSQPLKVSGKGTAYWFDMLGRAQHSEVYDNSEIHAPSTAGSYLLILQSEHTRDAHHIMVK